MSGPETTTPDELLRIDEERALFVLVAYIRDLCSRHSAEGILTGLSGGIDSAVVAGLAARALDPQSVHTMYLYDRDSGRDLGRNARTVANWLGIELEVESIEPDSREESAAVPWGMRAARLSPRINRGMFRLYRLMARESAFVSSLRAGAAGGDGSRGSGLGFVGRRAEELFYERHRYRRRVLESKAAEKDWQLLGGANRSEWKTGWFVKDGVDDLPHQPLLGLYKTQVRQLALYLGVPGEIVRQTPSPDMMPGISDEFALGMSYGKIDVALDHLAGGLSVEEVRATGVTGEDVRRVGEIVEASRWKRGDGTESFPVDGGRGGGLRVAS